MREYINLVLNDENKIISNQSAILLDKIFLNKLQTFIDEKLSDILLFIDLRKGGFACNCIDSECNTKLIMDQKFSNDIGYNIYIIKKSSK